MLALDQTTSEFATTLGGFCVELAGWHMHIATTPMFHITQNPTGQPRRFPTLRLHATPWRILRQPRQRTPEMLLGSSSPLRFAASLHLSLCSIGPCCIAPSRLCWHLMDPVPRSRCPAARRRLVPRRALSVQPIPHRRAQGRSPAKGLLRRWVAEEPRAKDRPRGALHWSVVQPARRAAGQTRGSRRPPSKHRG